MVATYSETRLIAPNVTVTAGMDISYLSDAVVMLRYFEHGGAVKKAISVLKKRTGGHEGSIRELAFSRSGIHLSEPLMMLRGVLTGVPVEVESDKRKRAE